MNLNNKVAVVTGVSKGIGNAMALQLLAKGMKVAGWGRSAPTTISDDNFIFIKTDVSNYNEVINAFNQTQIHFGNEIEVLINNAGLGYFKIFEELTVDELTEMMNTNVLGLMFCTKAILPQMKIQRSGHIINISSIAGTTGIPEGSGYCASKFAVRGFSQSLYKEARPFNVKVSCVYPGSVKTDFFVNYPAVKVSDDLMLPEEVATAIIHLLETPENILPVDLELRPMRVKM